MMLFRQLMASGLLVESILRRIVQKDFTVGIWFHRPGILTFSSNFYVDGLSRPNSMLDLKVEELHSLEKEDLQALR